MLLTKHEKKEKHNKSEENTEKSNNAELEEQVKRIAADFENFKKRTDKEKSELILYSSAKTIETFLPAYDAVEQAAESIDEESEEGKGIHLIKKQFLDSFKILGIEEIQALGKTFDSNIHECLTTEKQKGKKDMEILEVFQKGFTIKGRLLRPAKVKINQE